MYELVSIKRGIHPEVFHADDHIRSGLDTIRWWERSFELRRTKLRFRCTKKQVYKARDPLVGAIANFGLQLV